MTKFKILFAFSFIVSNTACFSSKTKQISNEEPISGYTNNTSSFYDISEALGLKDSYVLPITTQLTQSLPHLAGFEGFILIGNQKLQVISPGALAKVDNTSLELISKSFQMQNNEWAEISKSKLNYKHNSISTLNRLSSVIAASFHSQNEFQNYSSISWYLPDNNHISISLMPNDTNINLSGSLTTSDMYSRFKWISYEVAAVEKNSFVRILKPEDIKEKDSEENTIPTQISSIDTDIRLAYVAKRDTNKQKEELSQNYPTKQYQLKFIDKNSLVEINIKNLEPYEFRFFYQLITNNPKIDSEFIQKFIEYRTPHAQFVLGCPPQSMLDSEYRNLIHRLSPDSVMLSSCSNQDSLEKFIAIIDTYKEKNIAIYDTFDRTDSAPTEERLAH